MKQRVEELEKEVDSYKRQVRDQEEAGNCQDGTGSGSWNLNGNKDPNLNPRHASSSSVNTNCEDRSSNNSSRGDKDKGKGRNNSGYSMHMDTHSKGGSLAGRTRLEVHPPIEGALPMSSTTSILSPPDNSALLPNCLEQETHPRTNYPLQLLNTLGPTSTNFCGFISPPHSHSYNSPPEWPWPGVLPNNLYRDPMSQQQLQGKTVIIKGAKA